MLRIKKTECEALLRSSGENGLFLKALKFAKGADTHTVVWLDKDVSFRKAQNLCKKYSNGVLGLILGRGGGIGIRLVKGVNVANAVATIGEENCAPLLSDVTKYTVLGVHHHELQEDVLTTLHKLGWTCTSVARYNKQGPLGTRLIVAATSGPPCTVVHRGTLQSLLIRPTVSDDHPRRREERFTGRPVLQQKGAEQAEMEVDKAGFPLPPNSPKKNN